jgi:hypothetical protein
MACTIAVPKLFAALGLLDDLFGEVNIKLLITSLLQTVSSHFELDSDDRENLAESFTEDADCFFSELHCRHIKPFRNEIYVALKKQTEAGSQTNLTCTQESACQAVPTVISRSTRCLDHQPIMVSRHTFTSKKDRKRHMDSPAHDAFTGTDDLPQLAFDSVPPPSKDCFAQAVPAISDATTMTRPTAPKFPVKTRPAIPPLQQQVKPPSLPDRSRAPRPTLRKLILTGLPSDVDIAAVRLALATQGPKILKCEPLSNTSRFGHGVLVYAILAPRARFQNSLLDLPVRFRPMFPPPRPFHGRRTNGSRPPPRRPANTFHPFQAFTVVLDNISHFLKCWNSPAAGSLR